MVLIRLSVFVCDLRGLVFEEEDFQPSIFGYSLSPDINEQRVVAMLREAEDELNRKIRSKPADSPDTAEVQR